MAVFKTGSAITGIEHMSSAICHSRCRTWMSLSALLSLFRDPGDARNEDSRGSSSSTAKSGTDDTSRFF